MTMRVLALALLLPVGTIAGQRASARLTVGLSVSATDVAAGDSSIAAAALARGLRADSLVELVERPTQPEPSVRGAQFMVAVSVNRVGDNVRLNARAFNVETSAIAVRMFVSASTATLGDSATAVGRRIAQALAAKP
jgi:hypothetical protein